MTPSKSYITLNPFSISRPYQICLLVIAVFAVYYPAIFAEISILDDREAISCLFNMEKFDIQGLFFPRATEGGYYRPFLGISYYIDRFCWFLDPKIMHFENILMHLFNTLMVFWIGIRLCRQQVNGKYILPLFGAMLFALHPINTESINWISGRTDPMACTFVLGALLLVLNYREQRNILFIAGAFIMTIFGVFSKETSLGFFLAAIFILMAENNRGNSGKNPDLSVRTSHLVLFSAYTATAFLTGLFFSKYYVVIMIGIVYWLHCLIAGNTDRSAIKLGKRIRTALLVGAAFLTLVLIFYGFRKAAYVSSTSKMSNTLKVMFSDINYSIERFIGAAGYYVKKFFIPTPLTLAIREIDPLYELFGIICFMACIFLINTRRITSALVIGGFMMLSPAFPFVFGTFAWTGYAERYLYITSAFWILAGVSFVNELSVERLAALRNYGVFAGFSVLSIFAGITFQRNTLWQTNVGIFKDTVEKTPDFKNVRGLYMSALVEKKDYEGAERQYFIAKKLHSLTYDERYDLMYASILMNMKRYSEAECVFSEVESKTKGASVELYNSLIAYYDSRMFSNNDSECLKLFRLKKLHSYEKLYALNKSPYTSYRLGQAYIAVGSMEQARQAIQIAAEQLEAGEPLKRNAEVLLKTIEKNTGH